MSLDLYKRQQDLIAESRQRFESETDKHALTVLHDNGLYRHLRFRQPDRGMYWFDLVTWPGNLVVNGDCGAYHFARLDDMFQFFRAASGWNSGRINPSYWAEKLRAGEPSRYSEDLTRALVLDHVGDLEEYAPGITAYAQQWLADADLSTEASAEDYLDGFRYQGQWLDGWGEWRVREWDWAYLWNCHAIQWGISQYDKAQTAVPA